MMMNRSVLVGIQVITLFLCLISLFSAVPSVSAAACTCSCPNDVCPSNCKRCSIVADSCSCVGGCSTERCAAGYSEINKCGSACNCFFLFNTEYSVRTCQRTCLRRTNQCSECNPGRYGPECKQCPTCLNGGRCDDGISGSGGCICAPGYSGIACIYSRQQTCSGHGTPHFTFGTPCTCDQRYAGTKCDQCATNYYGYPNCVYCDSSSTCGGHGTCLDGSTGTGQCRCDAGYRELDNCMGPQIESVSPLYIERFVAGESDVFIDISGSYFYTDPGQVLIHNVNSPVAHYCSIVSWSNDKISCRLPRSISPQEPIGIVVQRGAVGNQLGQIANALSNEFEFDYICPNGYLSNDLCSYPYISLISPSSSYGPINTRFDITITGNYFHTNGRVIFRPSSVNGSVFNDIYCTAVSWTNQQIICTMPPMSGPLSGMFYIERITNSIAVLSDGISWIFNCPLGYSGPNCTDCDTNHYGPSCALCPDCYNNGRCSAGKNGTGTCICPRGYSVPNCYECASGYFGPTCIRCPPGGRSSVCNGHGICSEGKNGTGECTCEPGYLSNDACAPPIFRVSPPDVPAYTSVDLTIRGVYFYTTGNVIFRPLAGGGLNDINCDIKSWTNEKIICTLPPSPPQSGSIYLERIVNSTSQLFVGPSWRFYCRIGYTGPTCNICTGNRYHNGTHCNCKPGYIEFDYCTEPQISSITPLTASINTAFDITIIGYAFHTNGNVIFRRSGLNDINCVIKSWTNEKIICTLPPMSPPQSGSIIVERMTDSTAVLSNERLVFQ